MPTLKPCFSIYEHPFDFPTNTHKFNQLFIIDKSVLNAEFLNQFYTNQIQIWYGKFN